MQQRFRTFTLLMANITRSIRRIKTEEMAEFQLKIQHVSCLYYLYTVGALTPGELRELCEEDKANISRAIEYLEENGYVVRDSITRRYKYRLNLTEKGKTVAARMAEKLDAILEMTGASVSPEERDIMYRCLEKINTNLQTVCDAYDEK